MELCDYKCVLTGSSNFEIHHLYSFNKIVEEVMSILVKEGLLFSEEINDYNKDELDCIINRFQQIHNNYPLGICVRKDIHTLFHKIYGSGGNTEEQWNNFVVKFNDGEFTEILEI
jgi:hypothetical protein